MAEDRKRQHSWIETRGIERYGEQVLDALFGKDYIVVRATRAHQKQKIDRFLIHTRDGLKLWRVDYKVDIAAGRWKNLALEHISVDEKGTVKAKGWIHTTIADYVVFYVPQFDTAYVLKIKKLREAWPEIERTFPLKDGIETPDDYNGNKLKRPYTTKIYPASIKWLRDKKLIDKELLAVGVQFRLPLDGVA